MCNDKILPCPEMIKTNKNYKTKKKKLTDQGKFQKDKKVQ